MRTKQWVKKWGLLGCLLGLLAFSAAAQGAAAFDPWMGYTAIRSKEDLDAVRRNPAGNYYLAADILFEEKDFEKGGAFWNNGKGFLPLGGATAFTGVFDGRNYAVRGLQTGTGGLFGSNTGVVRRVTIVASGDGALLAQKNTGRVEYCFSDGEIKAEDGAGLVLVNSGLIRRCGNHAAITLSGSGIAGGICKENTGRITDCYNTGALSSKGRTRIGGVVGVQMGGQLLRCYNRGTLQSGGTVSGIVGREQGAEIAGCVSLEQVSHPIEQGFLDDHKMARTASAEEMKRRETYEDWNFDAVWTMAEGEAAPILQKDSLFTEKQTPVWQEGDGTKENPYRITRKEQLLLVGRGLDQCYRLEQDLIFSETDFAPGSPFWQEGLGWCGTIAPDAVFSGSFDGGGHQIVGLRLNSVPEDSAYEGKSGLLTVFAHNTGVIENVRLTDVRIQEDGKDSLSRLKALGLLTVKNDGIVRNCRVSGSVTLDDARGPLTIGMLTVDNTGEVESCRIPASLEVYYEEVSASTVKAAGIAVNNTGSIRNSSYHGQIKLTGVGEVQAAGIAVQNEGKGLLQNSYFEGQMVIKQYGDGTGLCIVGGIAASNAPNGCAARISRCFTLGNIYMEMSQQQSAGLQLGGIAGRSGTEAAVEDGYLLGTAECHSASDTAGTAHIGRIVGRLPSYPSEPGKRYADGRDWQLELGEEAEIAASEWITGRDNPPILTYLEETREVRPLLMQLELGEQPPTFAVGEAVSLDDLSVTLWYSDGKMRKKTGVLEADFDNLSYGRNTISAVYKEGPVTLRVPLEILICPKEVASVKCHRLPDVRAYAMGDQIRWDGGVLLATYHDGTRELVTISDHWCPPLHAFSPGIREVEVDFFGAKTTVEMAVYDRQMLSFDYVIDEGNACVYVPEQTTAEQLRTGLIPAKRIFLISSDGKALADETVLTTGTMAVYTDGYTVLHVLRVVVI